MNLSSTVVSPGYSQQMVLSLHINKGIVPGLLERWYDERKELVTKNQR